MALFLSLDANPLEYLCFDLYILDLAICDKNA